MENEQEIRQASTLILMRDRQEGGPCEVFVTKRPETMTFLPGYYVYPGGALEPQDFGKSIASRCTKACTIEDQFLAHRVAAIRECYEEIGVLLARDSHGEWVEDMMYEDVRNRIIQGAESFHEWVIRNGWTLEVDVLLYVGCRVTPKNPTNRRFETRFFMARIPRSKVPKVNEREVIEGMWLTPQEALQAYAQGLMKMAPPTLDSLRYLSRFRTVDEALKYTRKNIPLWN
ncbi:NUDIX hydrolase [Collibacillus ludicampi]|jgi:8-oxo-dGTP pyrophosphatase MutT (NUDIX family)|uniref:NUDIX hydrolase n=1 Tax=Collibacillus ludicampi TaxID=2771369 RepID=A0AAV4LAI3_9BACL|nr:NUDIX domain-containing protein [Collibacillus ludicampi]GIM44795.1 NUDIX hydrolase [Collibacillus ludicampi]